MVVLDSFFTIQIRGEKSWILPTRLRLCWCSLNQNGTQFKWPPVTKWEEKKCMNYYHLNVIRHLPKTFFCSAQFITINSSFCGLFMFSLFSNIDSNSVDEKSFTHGFAGKLYAKQLTKTHMWVKKKEEKKMHLSDRSFKCEEWICANEPLWTMWSLIGMLVWCSLQIRSLFSRDQMS